VVVAASQFLAQVAKDFFLRGHMGGGLVYGLIVSRVPWRCFLSLSLGCVPFRQDDFKMMYYFDVTFLKLIKLSFSKKNIHAS
jgi:hypothetical protein